MSKVQVGHALLGRLDGEFQLPDPETGFPAMVRFPRPAAFVDHTGTQHPRLVFRSMSADKLRARGMYPYFEDRPALAREEQYYSPPSYGAPQLSGGEVVVQVSRSLLPAEQILAMRLAQLAAHRFRVETGGMVVGEGEAAVVVETSRSDGQPMIHGAYSRAQRLGQAFAENWKLTEGVYFLVDHDTMLAIFDALGDHVSACFAREKHHAEQLALAAQESALAVAGYDFLDGEWPPNDLPHE